MYKGEKAYYWTLGFVVLLFLYIFVRTADILIIYPFALGLFAGLIHVKWAKRVNHNLDLMFIIGFIGNFISMPVYYMIYRFELSNQKKSPDDFPEDVPFELIIIPIVVYVLFSIFISWAFMIFPLFFFNYLMAAKTYEWAIRIKKEEISAFCIPIFLSLLGFIGYYIYYRSKRVKKKS